jgi:hypothetical protein
MLLAIAPTPWRTAVKRFADPRYWLTLTAVG